MKRYIEGEDRTQVTLLPECLDDYMGQDNPVRVVEAFVHQLDLRQMGFDGAAPAATGRPAYHPTVLLKLYICGYMNRIKYWMGWTHFLTKTLARVRTEMSLRVLAYNLKRVMRILGIGEMMRAMRA